MNEFQPNPLDAIANSAVIDLTQNITQQMTPKERDGAQRVIDWMVANKAAGYRRLARLLVRLKLNGPS